MNKDKQRMFHETLPSVQFEITIPLFTAKDISKGKKIRYKGVLCKVIRIDVVDVNLENVKIFGKLTPLERGL